LAKRSHPRLSDKNNVSRGLVGGARGALARHFETGGSMRVPRASGLTAAVIATIPLLPCKGSQIHPALPRPPQRPSRWRRRPLRPRIDTRTFRVPSPRRPRHMRPNPTPYWPSKHVVEHHICRSPRIVGRDPFARMLARSIGLSCGSGCAATGIRVTVPHDGADDTGAISLMARAGERRTSQGARRASVLSSSNGIQEGNLK
jgi:hypothetical protein